tara:strand:+ start:167 stop:358 length:192 start_codon:yes stop_codon:yes gene_type:complete
MEFLSYLFQLCVNAMHLLADVTNTTYKEINAIVFLIIQPGLVLFFFLLWRYEKKKTVTPKTNP